MVSGLQHRLASNAVAGTHTSSPIAEKRFLAESAAEKRFLAESADTDVSRLLVNELGTESFDFRLPVVLDLWVCGTHQPKLEDPRRPFSCVVLRTADFRNLPTS